MNIKSRKIRARANWIKTYQELGSVSRAALRCGIPRSTLYRWIKRHEAGGENPLSDKSQKPIKLAKQKVTPDIEKLILSLREQHKFGPQRISTHLFRNHQIILSVFLLFTAVDDCTRLRVLRLYFSKQAENTVQFLYEVMGSFNFPIQRIQTDWGTEFYNDLFQEELMTHFIKFRPIKPRSPHLNGKVERSQQTDKAEFYNHLNLKDRTLEIKSLLANWEHFYNHLRPHASLNGKTPYERYLELEKELPTQPDVTLAYLDKPEEIKPRNNKYLTWVQQFKMSHMS